MAGPVTTQPHRGNRVDDIDAGTGPGLLLTVLVIPVKELLDVAHEQIGADITKDRCSGECGLHVGAPARLAAVDILRNHTHSSRRVGYS